jgi:uncharacterized protein (TIGR00255 family)
MTGFARREGQIDDADWVWELRSVNGKGLDLRLRMPPGHEELEGPIRADLSERLKRGNVTVSLQLRWTGTEGEPRVNKGLLDQILRLHGELAGTVDTAPPRLDTLLGIRGVIEVEEARESEEARARRMGVLMESFRDAAKALAEARRAEGEKLAGPLSQHLEEVESLASQAGKSAALQPEAIRAKLKERVAELMTAEPNLPEERLAQEAALLALKADVREELDRLTAHVAAARELLDQDQPVGRRLDFLCQEFNREVNTICSKAQDMELTRLGLDMKAAVDRFREQIQNIE